MRLRPPILAGVVLALALAPRSTAEESLESISAAVERVATDLQAGAHEGAEARLAEALEALAAFDDDDDVALVLGRIHDCALGAGARPLARAATERALAWLERSREEGDPAIAWARIDLGNVMVDDLDGALALQERGLATLTAVWGPDDDVVLWA